MAAAESHAGSVERRFNGRNRAWTPGQHTGARHVRVREPNARLRECAIAQFAILHDPFSTKQIAQSRNRAIAQSRSMNLWIVLFTLRVAALSTAIIFPIALAIAALLPRLPSRARTVVETLCSLPLILPPTAVGFLLLEVFSRHHWLGAWLDARGIEVLFTPAAVVIATSVMAFPLMFRAFRVALDAVERRYIDVARTLGATPLDRKR